MAGAFGVLQSYAGAVEVADVRGKHHNHCVTVTMVQSAFADVSVEILYFVCRGVVTSAWFITANV